MSLSNIQMGMHALNNSYNPLATAHAGMTSNQMVQLAADGGSTVVRVPLDLSRVGPNGLDSGAINDIRELLVAAEQYGLKGFCRKL